MANKIFLVGFSLASLTSPLSTGGGFNPAVSPRQIAARDTTTIGSISLNVPVELLSGTPEIHAPRRRSRTLFVVTGPDPTLRDRPASDSRVVTKLAANVRLRELGRRDDWVLVRGTAGLQGWVQASGVTAEEPRTAARRRRHDSASKRLGENTSPMLSDDTIVNRLIQESIARHPGPCVCPYHPREGSTLCETLSAHSRGGSRAPLCFASEITPAMITAYRQQHVRPPASTARSAGIDYAANVVQRKPYGRSVVRHKPYYGRTVVRRRVY
jgi:Bacterial SH3 domain